MKAEMIRISTVNEELKGKPDLSTGPSLEPETSIIRTHSFPLGANMKNASLVTEVEELNRKVREILEQVREKDRQISKLQGNYSKVSFQCMSRKRASLMR